MECSVKNILRLLGIHVSRQLVSVGCKSHHARLTLTYHVIRREEIEIHMLSLKKLDLGVTLGHRSNSA